MKLEIENLKGIRSLEFDFPGPGLWLLTGVNGSGKSSLLAALYRVGYGRAFQEYFKTTAGQDRIDLFENTRIRYHIDGDTVTYAYGGTRWRPKPSKNAEIIRNTPYQSVVFVGADASRIEPFPDEIEPRNTRDVAPRIKNNLIEILDDGKWGDLKYVNTRRGRGNEAYLIATGTQRRQTYYSEKNFSLGELCVLKLVKKLDALADNSLVLIDEIEMALHPQAQVRLLKWIRRIAEEKNHTVIFSTHSSTLIKSVDRKNIILLRGNGRGSFEILTNVFPAEVLGELAFDEELSSDFVLLVEDIEAKLLLEQLCALFMQNRDATPPSYSILPIGGFRQVMEFLERSAQILPDYVTRYAFLDEDVRETLEDAREKNRQTIVDLYDRVADRVQFLPCTPELALVEALERRAEPDGGPAINFNIAGNVVRLRQFIRSRDYQQIDGARPRRVAKKKLDAIVSHIVERSGADDIHVRRTLYQDYCSETYGGDIGAVVGLLNPVFRM